MKETEKKYNYSQFTDEDAALYKDILDSQPYRPELQDLFATFKREEERERKSDKRHLSRFALNLDSLDMPAQHTCLAEVLIEQGAETKLQEMIKELPAAIEKLSPVCRRRIIEHYYLGISISQIARKDRVRRQIVQRSIRAAEKKLKTFF